jgi:hypothetical protein
MEKKKFSLSVSHFINTKEGQESYRKWQIKKLKEEGYADDDKRVKEIEKKIKTPKVKEVEVEKEEELY